MTHLEQLAAFVVCASYDDLSEAARQQLKIRTLDALGCAIGALEGRPVQFIQDQIIDFGGSFSLMPPQAVKALIDICHQHNVLVSTGGFIEYVLTQGAEAVKRNPQVPLLGGVARTRKS